MMLRGMKIGLMLCIMLALAVLTTQAAMVRTSTQDDRPIFTKLIGPNTLGFLHSRFADMMKSPVVQAFYDKVPQSKEQMDTMLKGLIALKSEDIDTFTIYLDQLRFENGQPQEPRPPYFLIHTSQAFDKAAVLTSLGENSETVKIDKYELRLGKDRGIVALDDKTLLVVMLVGPRGVDDVKQNWQGTLAQFNSPGKVPEGLQTSIELARSNKHHVVAGFTLSKELSAMAQEQAKNLPATLAPFKALSKIQSGALTADYLSNVENDFKLAIQARFEDEGGAKAGLGAVRFAIAGGKIAINSVPKPKEPEMLQMLDFAKKQLDIVKTEAVENVVHVRYEMNIGKLMPMLLSATERVRFAADKLLSASNMRQCVIAMHNYHNDYNKMPEAFTMKGGKRLHSWRVLMLPYLEHDNYFKQIKIDEPWDSEHNKKFFESNPMPKVYAHPGKKDGDSKKTYYKVFYSKAGAQPSAGFQLGKATSLSNITDGTSNTIAMVEAGPPVLWYQPEDIEFDANAPFPQLISPWKQNLVNVAFFDGSIHTAWLGQAEDIWKAAVTVNGGEAFDFSKLEEKQVEAKK